MIQNHLLNNIGSTLPLSFYSSALLQAEQTYYRL